MGDIMDLPFSPQEVHVCNDKQLLIVDVDGGVTRISRELDEIEETRKPFPTQISSSIICGDQFIGFWIDHELLTARFAGIELDGDFADGCTRADLRVGDAATKGSLHVEGALWSHAMTAELLAMAECDGVICFVLWKRGIYAVGHDSKEIWRKEPLEWQELESIPRSLEVVSIISTDDEFVVWSRGGGWVQISPSDGQIIKQGVVNLPNKLDMVFHHKDSGWLLICGNEALLMKDLFQIHTNAVFRSPINHAAWDNEISSWRITGWRMDAIFGDSIGFSERSEIGVHSGYYRGDWYVLDNSGKWSKHMPNDDDVVSHLD